MHLNNPHGRKHRRPVLSLAAVWIPGRRTTYATGAPAGVGCTGMHPVLDALSRGPPPGTRRSLRTRAGRDYARCPGLESRLRSPASTRRASSTRSLAVSGRVVVGGGGGTGAGMRIGSVPETGLNSIAIAIAIACVVGFVLPPPRPLRAVVQARDPAVVADVPVHVPGLPAMRDCGRR
jgi:hypothetical protein